MFRLPLLFIATGIISFLGFHVLSLFSLGSWIGEPPRNPDGWFRIHLMVLSTACAVGYLVLTGCLGIMMGIDFVSPIWGGIHDHLLSAHIWMGTIGWFGLLITGFSYKMLPMFYLSHGESAKRPVTIVVIWNVATLLGAIHFLLGGSSYFDAIVIVLLLAALIMYEIHMRDIRKHRHKGTPGSGIRWTIFCTRGLIVYAALLLGAWFVKPDLFEDEGLLMMTGWAYLYGWVAMTILGYLSKIVPFLWWTHKYGPLAGKRKVPVMNDLIHDRYVYAGMAGMCAGLLILLPGTGWHVTALVWIGGSLLSVCSLVYIGFIVCVFAR